MHIDDLGSRAQPEVPMFRYFENLLIPTAIDAPGEPPQGMLAFDRFFGRQVRWFLVGLLVLGALLATVDAAVPVLIGWTVNLVATTDLARLFSEFWPILLGGVGIVLVLRPLVVLTQSLLQFQTIFPGLTNLVRWQSHQHVVRQSIGYFQSDFAGVSPAGYSKPATRCAPAWCRSSRSYFTWWRSSAWRSC